VVAPVFLGVLTTPCFGRPPLYETHLALDLARYARRKGGKRVEVIIFTPADIHVHEGTIRGWMLTEKGIHQDIRPIPDVLYDRYMPCKAYPASYAVQFIRRAVRYRLNRGLPDKWQQFLTLKKAGFDPFLPEQRLYVNDDDILSWAEPELIVKPRHGAFGRGVLYVRKKYPYRIHGRDGKGRIISLNPTNERTLLTYLDPYRGKSLIQQYLDLSAADGTPYDLRLFLQKTLDRRSPSMFNILGGAVRKGPPDGLTANLSGGGKALPLTNLPPYLNRFDAQHILRTVQDLASTIAFHLSHTFPPQLEMGLDLAVDQHGSIYFLEANARPGRGILRATDLNAYWQSISGVLMHAQTIDAEEKEVRR